LNKNLFVQFSKEDVQVSRALTLPEEDKERGERGRGELTTEEEKVQHQQCAQREVGETLHPPGQGHTQFSISTLLPWPEKHIPPYSPTSPWQHWLVWQCQPPMVAMPTSAHIDVSHSGAR
jgi:hypothetical protein